jgi:cytochrome c553
MNHLSSTLLRRGGLRRAVSAALAVPSLLLVLAGLLAHPGRAQAQAQASALDRQARVWAASCATCHGTDGHAQGVIPALAGRDVATLLAALGEFKAGQRPAASVMHQHAKGYSDDELRRIALYYASLPAR